MASPMMILQVLQTLLLTFPLIASLKSSQRLQPNNKNIQHFQIEERGLNNVPTYETNDIPTNDKPVFKLSNNDIHSHVLKDNVNIGDQSDSSTKPLSKDSIFIDLAKYVSNGIVENQDYVAIDFDNEITFEEHSNLKDINNGLNYDKDFAFIHGIRTESNNDLPFVDTLDDIDVDLTSDDTAFGDNSGLILEDGAVHKTGLKSISETSAPEAPEASEAQSYPFQNTSLSWEDRVDNLVDLLTLEEIQLQVTFLCLSICFYAYFCLSNFLYLDLFFSRRF